MADRHHKRRRPTRKPKPGDFVVRCSCECPFWGQEHDDIWNCRCDTCGTESIVCGHCLCAGRSTQCTNCSTRMN